MSQLFNRASNSRWARVVPVQLAVSAVFGLLVAGVAYVGLGLVLNGPSSVEGEASAVIRMQAQSSLTGRIAADKVAIAAPPQGAEGLLAQTQPGDRLDILAVFPPTASLPPLSSLLIRGAVVIARPIDTSGTPIILEMTSEESLALTHVLLSGAHIAYTVWPSAGGPPAVPAVDPSALRARFSPS